MRSLSEAFDTDIPTMSDADLIGQMIRMLNPQTLVDDAGGTRKLSMLTVPELKALGLVEHEAELLALAFELGRRSNACRVPRGAPLVSSLDVYRQFRPTMRDLRKEIFMAALLDTKNHLIREVRISEGSLSASLVHPREAFAPAVREPAHGVIFVHNHPSGNPEPSDEDIALTKRLVACGDVLGIRVLDHVVIGDDDYYSFADSGKLRVQP